MSKSEKVKTVRQSIAIATLVIFMTASCIIAFIAVKPYQKTEIKYSVNAIETAAAYTEAQIKAFDNSSSRRRAEFSTELFNKCFAAGMIYGGNEKNLEQAAETLSLDAVAITDDKSNFIAAYSAVTEGDDVRASFKKGENLKKIDAIKLLNSVVKNNTTKKISDPITTPDGKTMFVVATQLKNDEGAIIGTTLICVTPENYAELQGAELAESCGPNVLVAKDGTTISCTFEAGKDLNLADFAKKGSKPFKINLDKKTYDAVYTTVGNYQALTLMEAQPRIETDDNHWVIFISILSGNLILAAAGAVLFLTSDKKKNKKNNE